MKVANLCGSSAARTAIDANVLGGLIRWYWDVTGVARVWVQLESVRINNYSRRRIYSSRRTSAHARTDVDSGCIVRVN
jgi:hypothetical protein